MAKEREEAIFIRDDLLTWFEDSSLGRVNFYNGEVTRDNPRDPPHFQDDHDQELLDRYCPGLWGNWAKRKDRRTAMLDELQHRYTDLQDGIRQIVDEQAADPETFIDYARLSDNIHTELKRLTEKRGFKVEPKHGPNSSQLLYEGTDPTASGVESKLWELRIAIVTFIEGPVTSSLASYIKEIEHDSYRDFEFDEEKGRAIQKLETRFRLQKKTPYNIAALGVQ